MKRELCHAAGNYVPLLRDPSIRVATDETPPGVAGIKGGGTADCADVRTRRLGNRFHPPPFNQDFKDQNLDRRSSEPKPSAALSPDSHFQAAVSRRLSGLARRDCPTTRKLRSRIVHPLDSATPLGTRRTVNTAPLKADVTDSMVKTWNQCAQLADSPCQSAIKTAEFQTGGADANHGRFLRVSLRPRLCESNALARSERAAMFSVSIQNAWRHGVCAAVIQCPRGNFPQPSAFLLLEFVP